MAEETNDYGKRSHHQSEYSGNGGSKRRNPTDESNQNMIGVEDTVYRYLCPIRKIGSIIGRGGEIAKQLRAETQSKLRINDVVPGCDERVVTIYSSNTESNIFEDSEELVSPAMDCLFRVHDRIIADDTVANDEFEGAMQVTVRMIVPSDQIGCVIGKGGQVIQNIRTETKAQIRVLSNEHVPLCAMSCDELLQISGEPTIVRKALYQVASRLHDNPSKNQHFLLSLPNVYRNGGPVVMGSSSVMGPYGDWSGSVRDFSLRLVCPTENVGGVIGKGGAMIKQIRMESGASIKVDSDAAEGDDCIISISSKESFQDPSPAIDAVMRLQPRASERLDKESGESVITTRLLVHSSRIGCLIGKGGSIISEMRNMTRASIRIITQENLPKIAAADDEMVQITGDLNVASSALLQVTMRLRANLFETEGAPPPSNYIPFDTLEGSRYGGRDSKPRGRGRYDSGDSPPPDSYCGSKGGETGHGGYSSRSGSAGAPGRKHHGY